MDNILVKDLSAPLKCEKCDGKLIYQGLGGYKCEDCGHMMYDDYGKVREYLDVHPGATVSEVSVATHVPTGKIREMVKQERFEATANSAIMFSCEKCGAPIRSGRLCEACNKAFSAFKSTQKTSSNSSSKVQGFGVSKDISSGEKRFKRT